MILYFFSSFSFLFFFFFHKPNDNIFFCLQFLLIQIPCHMELKIPIPSSILSVFDFRIFIIFSLKSETLLNSFALLLFIFSEWQPKIINFIPVFECGVLYVLVIFVYLSSLIFLLKTFFPKLIQLN